METPAPHPPLTILAVEENPADVATIRWVLTAYALTYDLQVIEHADHALHFFDQLTQPEYGRCPEILRLDRHLPQRHGTDVLRHLTALPACAALRVVILTASGDPAERTETRSAKR
jgi:CheY-like chemotaxis protein